MFFPLRKFDPKIKDQFSPISLYPMFGPEHDGDNALRLRVMREEGDLFFG